MNCSGIGSALQPALGLLSSIPGIRRSPATHAPPRPFAPQPATSPQDLDAKIARLDAAKRSWVAQTPAHRIELLRKVLANCLEVAPYLASDCVQAKGSYGGGLGEET